jgi:predicted Zn finger-like uncharacterized protein
MPEITQCPQCQRKLNVQEAQLGQTVQCPVCGTFFTAAILSTQRQPPPPPPVPEERDTRRYDEPPPRPRDNDERRPRYDDDYDRGRRYGPPRRGYGRYGDPYAEPMTHRGGLVLALGLAGMLLSCIPFAGWILGGIALSMANTDLPRMDRGYMDRGGRGLTVGGQVCGIIAVIINSIMALIICSGLPEAFH